MSIVQPGNIPEPTLEYLNARQELDYSEEKTDFRNWLLNVGKEPAEFEGYSERTVDNYTTRIDQFLRWVWSTTDRYTTAPPHEKSDQYVELLKKDEIRRNDGQPYSVSSKRKMTNALEAFYQWRAHERDGQAWTPPFKFRDTSNSHPDEFTREERLKLREAALTYDSIPRYNDLSPEERDRWKAYLAQKLGKPKEDVVPDDWKRVNQSWKIPSLIHTTLDAGLRPCEIEVAKISWLRAAKNELHIPKEDSAKNRDHWNVTLLPKTTKLLRRWIEQRENITKYDGREEIWLNRQANPYQSGSLNTLLDNLCEEAEIDQTNRRIVWYSFRHSLGTHMTTEGDLAQTKEQMRHKSIQSTLQYVHPSHEERRNSLRKIG